MRRIPTRWVLLLLLAGLLLPLAGVHAQDDVSEDEMIEIVAATEPFPDWLAQHEGWRGVVDRTNAPMWEIGFYAADDEWLGYATINIETQEIGELFAPTPLPEDEFVEGQKQVYRLVIDDPEVQARLVDPIIWGDYTEFNRWDRVWEVHFWHGIEALVVRVELDEDGNWYSIQSIRDENEMDAAERRDDARTQAISLAYGADGVWDALDGYDDWEIYATPFNGSIWAVEFVVGESDLFYALVDVTTDTVLETKAMDA